MSFSADELNEQNQNLPAWLKSLLRRKFFGACPYHVLQKNELNMYCITCEKHLCRYCVAMGTHDEDDHKLLQIYRHVYQDVVTLKDMEEHMDCSKIQPYKCNKKWIIALNPLPHCGSGAQIDRNLSCLVCKRKLMDPGHYRYCCIACKMGVLPNKRKGLDSSTPYFALATSMSAGEVETETGQKLKHRRKGIPRRAPLF